MTTCPPRGDAGSSDPIAEVLFALSVCGALTPGELARGTGLDEEAVGRALAELRGSGGIATAGSPRGGAALTEQGRARAADVVRREREALAAELASLYAKFAVLDRRLKEAVTRWQVRTVGGVDVANDHRDRAHDAAVVEDLGDLCARAVVWLDPLARRRSRYRRYRERLESALGRIQAGEVGWIAGFGVGVDSVHAIWWQLHADLLAVLGRERGASEA